MDTKALQQKILDLAIRGKLVPQDPNDEPASVLLERIREQKQQMVKEGKLKKKDIKNDSVIFVGEDNLHYEKFQDGTVKCIEDEIPFELPEGWAWTRLGGIGNWQSGATPSRHHLEYYGGSIPWLKTGDLNDGFINSVSEYITKEGFNNSSVVLNPVGSVLIAMYGATIGKLGITNIEVTTNQACCACLPIIIINHYLFYFLMYQKKYFIEKAVGGAQPNISKEKIVATLFPVPPLREQKELVSMINKLISKIDSIASCKNEIENIIAITKSRILDLAIRGKLVPQDPNDEPASVLLERIRAEKEELIKQGKIKRDKKKSVIFKGEDNSYYEKIGDRIMNIDDEIPFEVPDNWSWCRGYSCFKGIESTKPQGEFFDYIDIDSIDNRLHRIKKPKHLLVSDAPSRANRSVKNGSVLFSLVRPYLENIALIEEKYSHCIASTGFYVCNSNGAFLPEFMFYLMISGYVVGGLNQYMKGDNSPSINKDNIEGWLYPIPPIKEQKKIFTKLQTVFAMIESVEKGLN